MFVGVTVCLHSCSCTKAWWWPTIEVANSWQIINRNKGIICVWLKTSLYKFCREYQHVIVIRKPVPVAARSKAWVYGRSPAEIVGSNPTEGMYVCLLWVWFVVRWRSLRRTDHSSRGVIPTMVRRWVWSRNLVNEEEDLPPWGAVALKTYKQNNVVKKSWISCKFL